MATIRDGSVGLLKPHLTRSLWVVGVRTYRSRTGARAAAAKSGLAMWRADITWKEERVEERDDA